MEPALAWLISVLVVFGPGIALLIFMAHKRQDTNGRFFAGRKPAASPHPLPNSIDSVAAEVAKRVAANFSAVRFPDFFGDEPFREGWSRNDALALWYCLGYFCFLVAGGSAVKDESTANPLLYLGLKHLLHRWKMPPPVSARFEQFCHAKLGPVFTLYESLSNAREFRQFFGLFVSEIVGNDISFSRESLNSFVLGMKGKQINADVALHLSVSGFFVAALNEAKEYIRSNVKEAAHPENAPSNNAESRETESPHLTDTHRARIQRIADEISGSISSRFSFSLFRKLWADLPQEMLPHDWNWEAAAIRWFGLGLITMMRCVMIDEWQALFPDTPTATLAAAVTGKFVLSRAGVDQRLEAGIRSFIGLHSGKLLDSLLIMTESTHSQWFRTYACTLCGTPLPDEADLSRHHAIVAYTFSNSSPNLSSVIDRLATTLELLYIDTVMEVRDYLLGVAHADVHSD